MIILSKLKGLSVNVSYVKATDTSGSGQLTYAITSKIFLIDEKSGSVYLVAWLEPSPEKLQRYEYVEIMVTDGHGNKLSIRNRIVILNINSQPPEFIAPTNTYFELLEVLKRLLNLKFKYLLKKL